MAWADDGNPIRWSQAQVLAYYAVAWSSCVAAGWTIEYLCNADSRIPENYERGGFLNWWSMSVLVGGGYGVLPMRKKFLISLQLVVNTSRRPVKYGRRRHTTIVYPRFELRLLVNRGGNR